MKIRVLGSAAGGGAPQWNCGCDNCVAIRNHGPNIRARTQESVAVSADGERWLLLNASPEIRQQIESVDPQEGPTRVATMNQLLAESVAQPRFNAFLIGLFAILAFVLAAVGVYGVISYDVTQRTSEIGIRLALGAQVTDIYRLILKHGALLTLTGLLLGLAGAAGLTRFLTTLLFGVEPIDLATYAIVSGMIVLVSLAACVVPSRRATKVDPLEALRHE